MLKLPINFCFPFNCRFTPRHPLTAEQSTCKGVNPREAVLVVVSLQHEWQMLLPWEGARQEGCSWGCPSESCLGTF